MTTTDVQDAKIMQAQDTDKLFRKWLVFVSRFTVMFFLTSSVKTGGILFTTVSKDVTGAMSGFILILPYAVGRLSGPIVSVLLNFFSYRVLGTVGGVLVGGGYILSGLFATSVFQHIFFSIVSGFGFGCLLLPVSLCLKDHFQEEFPSIMPLSMAGSYAGITVMPPLMELCRQAYGNEGTLILFGALSWNLIPCGLLLQKPVGESDTNLLKEDVEEEGELENEVISENHLPCEDKISKKTNAVIEGDGTILTGCHKVWSDIKENLFLFTSLVFSVFFFVANARKLPADGWTLFLIPHTIENGFPSIQAAQVASVGGITGIAGRFIASISFKFTLSPILVYAFYFFLNGAVFILMEWVRWSSGSLIAQYVGSALNGCLLSVQSGMTPGMLVYILDASSFRTAYGLLDLGNGVLSLAAGLVPGFLFDRSGNFGFAFMLFGFISTLNGILVCALWFLVHFRRKRPFLK